MPGGHRPGPLAPLLLLGALLAAGTQGATPVAAPATTTTDPRPATTEAPTTTVVATTTTTTLPPTFPLTGRPATDPATAARPAVSVKIDNVAAARPQSGLAAADVVYEEFTEGVTRFIAVYHSTDAETLGPVRSVRPADPVIVTPLRGILAFSGGSPAAVALARAGPFTIVTENDTAVMYRRRGRAAPHNLYTSSGGLRSRVAPEAGPPPALAVFLRDGQPFGGAGAEPVAGLHLVPAPYLTATYDWDPATGTWLRSTDGRPHLLEEGRAAPTTVVVQFTPYVVFSADAKVMYPEVLGSGDVWVFASGSVVRGTWSKPSPDAVTTLADSAGAPIALPPGQVWVHLLAPGSPVQLR